ncbi:hypothetical protein Ae201684_008428 [Aphanomyces euteiches]|uniref:Uncharacterized protein n=1 Tax=Aphanomyces euteiches TaxID=100861 RepID=A0A6G0X4Q5_9STRA|nr:hypothetical protein Ae201684_008428 [Aphanomyces euteiches]KAH9149868.1 hypothetical protein AeRB84_007184 [Aphanomyces euteiches]
MSALLIKWINTDFNLRRKVVSLEKDLSNGFLLGELLHELKLETDFTAYIDSDSVPSTLANFERLATSLGAIHITLSVEMARSIMMEKKGAAAKVLMELKALLDRRQAKHHHSQPSTASVRPPPEVTRRHFCSVNSKDTNEKFVENLIDSLDPADVNNHNRVDMAIHLRKFSEFMWQTEQQNSKFFSDKRQQELAAKAQQRERDISHLHEKQEFLKNWCDEGQREWATNQAVKTSREATQLSFELGQREKRRLIAIQNNDIAASDLEDGVTSFDRNFNRLGISTGSDEKVHLARIQGTALEHISKLEQEVNKCQFRPASNIQMMKELRERRKIHLNAQKERASRRRKMLVDQTRNTIEINRKQEETVLLKRLLDEGKIRRDILASLWKARHLSAQDKEANNAALAQKEIESAQRIDRTLKESLDALHLVATASPRRQEAEMKLHAARVAKAHQSSNKRQVHIQTCHEVINVLLDMVWFVIKHREANGKAALPPQQYRELKVAFVAGNVVPKPILNAKLLARQSRTELSMLQHYLTSTRGMLEYPELGQTPEYKDIPEITQTLYDLTSKTSNENLLTPWKPHLSPHLLLVCWYNNDTSFDVVSTFAERNGLQILTIDSCVEKSIKFGERVKSGEKLAAIESELASLGNKVATLRAKNGIVTDSMISDIVCKAILHTCLNEPPPRLGYIVHNFPRSKDEAKTFELEIIRRLVHLSDTDMATRTTQLTAALDEKRPLTEEMDLPPMSSIDLVIFENCGGSHEFAEADAEVVKSDDDVKDMQAKWTVWNTMLAALEAFWKPFGCSLTIAPRTMTPFGFDETLHALFESICTHGHELHALQVRDESAYLKAIDRARDSRRQSLQTAELLICRELAGEIKLPHNTLPELHDALAVKGVRDLCDQRMANMQTFYDSLSCISDHFQRLRKTFLRILEGEGRQAYIDKAINNLRKKDKATLLKKEFKDILIALEVKLGDIVDAARKAGNAFIHSPENWTFSVSGFQNQTKSWLERIVSNEIRALDYRLANLSTYFESVEHSVLEDTSLVPEEFQPLVNLLVERSVNLQEFGDTLAPLVSIIHEKPQIAHPESKLSRQQRIIWTERAHCIRYVLCATNLAVKLVLRLSSLQEVERQSYDSTIIEFMRQEHVFIRQVVDQIKAEEAKQIVWPRSQSLLTPYDNTGIHLQWHPCFLRPHAILALTKALAQAPEQTQGEIELTRFVRIVLDVANTCGDFPAVWKISGCVSNAGLAFCYISQRVDWRQFIVSLLSVQAIPQPRFKQLANVKLVSGMTSCVDASWNREEFLALEMWFDENITDRHRAELKDILFHTFADSSGHVHAATFLLYWCSAIYPQELISVCHPSLASFPRGLVKAFRVLYFWNPEVPSWNAQKWDILLAVGRVDPASVKRLDNHNGDVVAFLAHCESEGLPLANRWTFQNVYDHLLQ